MRFLYGDSHASPLQYNLLSTLDSLTTMAPLALQLDLEVQEIRKKTAEAIANREHAVGALEAFHNATMQHLASSAEQNADARVKEYQRLVRDSAGHWVEETRAKCGQAVERDTAAAKTEIDRRRGEIRTLLSAFLTNTQLPSLEAQLSMNLVDSRNQLSAEIKMPQGIVAAFALSAPAPQWAMPRRVAEFVQGVDLQIGTRKSWIKRTVEPDRVQIDEFVVGGFEFAGDAAELRLRKRPEQRDSLVFSLRREEAHLTVELHRPLEEEEGTGQVLEANDAARIEGLLQLLRSAAKESLSHKERLLSVTLEGKNLFEQDKLLPFFERIVNVLAPEVVEMVLRSPNPEELSLKVENDAGRREEVYLRRDTLQSRLDKLPAQAREAFSPLGLSDDNP